MNSLLIKNCVLATEQQNRSTRDVLCQNGKIVKIAKSIRASRENSEHIVDANGEYLAPGFIDMHIHGIGRHLTDNGSGDLDQICRVLPQYGVTGFLPTVSPLPDGKDAALLKQLARVKSRGAQILGFHLEGPFLAITGALSKDAIGKPDSKRAENLIKACKPYKPVFSVSPELEGMQEVVKIIRKHKCRSFITHTRADVKQTQSVIAAGARHATHFYDVFYAPDPVEPGVRPCGAVEAILADPRVSVDFILDGEHVDPVAVKMALQCKGEDMVCLITDANIGAGAKPGRYKFSGREIEFAYQGGPARLADTKSLAGSGLTMIQAVKNAVKMLGVELSLAVKMASHNPAKALGLEKRKGSIEEGFDADMVLLDKKLNVRKCWIQNKCCFEK